MQERKAVPARSYAVVAKQFAALFVLGMLGIVALVVASVPAIEGVAQTAGVPVAVLAFASIMQSAVLLAICVAIGLWLAPKVGLHSLVADRLAGERAGGFRRGLPAGLIMGVAVCLIVIVFDIATRSLMPSPRVEQPGAPTVPSPVSLVAPVLYGGITEELLLRWGVMTLLVWIGWRVFQRGAGRPSGRIMWAAILVSALLFGLGHLPATAQIFPLTPFVFARMLLLNGLFGVAAGWLYWRYSLETAMTAHVTFHLVLIAVNLGIAAFGGPGGAP